jgi:hypothetical protein
MARQISDETRSETASCPFSFQCLDDSNRDVCEVDYCLKKSGCFLKSTKPNYCTYKLALDIPIRVNVLPDTNFLEVTTSERLSPTR